MSTQRIMVKLLSIRPSDRADKKYMARFDDGTTTHFGAKGMSDFTKHRDEERKDRYIARHRANENWNDPKSAGALARFVLWNKPTLRASIEDYKRRFNV
jgi:hypothetical protein